MVIMVSVHAYLRYKMPDVESRREVRTSLFSSYELAEEQEDCHWARLFVMDLPGGKGETFSYVVTSLLGLLSLIILYLTQTKTINKSILHLYALFTHIYIYKNNCINFDHSKGIYSLFFIQSKGVLFLFNRFYFEDSEHVFWVDIGLFFFFSNEEKKITLLLKNKII